MEKTEQTFWLIQWIIVIKRAISTCIDTVRQYQQQQNVMRK